MLPHNSFFKMTTTMLFQLSIVTYHIDRFSLKTFWHTNANVRSGEIHDSHYKTLMRCYEQGLCFITMQATTFIVWDKIFVFWCYHHHSSSGKLKREGQITGIAIVWQSMSSLYGGNLLRKCQELITLILTEAKPSLKVKVMLMFVTPLQTVI